MKTLVAMMLAALFSTTVVLSQGAKGDAAKDRLLSAPDLKGATRLMLSNPAPNEIGLRKATLAGPLVVLAKSDNPLQTFNPFVPSDNANEAGDFKTDRILGRPRGIVLFSVRF